MIPILYEKNEKQFRTYGLGEVPFLKCEVTRVRNGEYTLYAEYPSDDVLAKELIEGRFIKANSGVRTKFQTFEIVRVHLETDGILKVYGNHISMRTVYSVIPPDTKVDSVTAQGALEMWRYHLIGDNDWEVWSDITSVASTTWTAESIKNARNALGGARGSIIDIWGGEYEFDNRRIRLHKQLGRRVPTTIEYGKNLVSAENDRDILSTYTTVYPFVIVQEGEGESQERYELPEKIIHSPHVDKYDAPRVLLLDLSTEFDEKKKPTVERIRQLTQAYIRNNDIGVPKTELRLSYVDLSSTLDYEEASKLEEVELCDIVPVFYSKLGITDTQAKINRVEFDVLRDENKSVSVGVIGKSITQAIVSQFNSDLSNLSERTKKIERSPLAQLASDGVHMIYYDTPPSDKEHKKGDMWHEKNGQYQRLYIWNGTMWEKIIDTEDLGVAERRIGELEQRAGELQESIGDIDDLRKKINETSVNGQMTAEIIGQDGKMKYSKNRLDLELKPNELLTFEEGTLVIKHNGLGFVPGHEYTISFTMAERERPHSRVDIQTTVNATVTLTPQVNSRYPTKTGATHDKVYHDTYLVTITYPNKAPIVLTKQLQSDWSIRIDLHDLEPHIQQRIVGAKIETKITNDNAVHIYTHYGVIRDCVRIGG